MASGKRKPCPRGRFKRGSRKGHCKPAGSSKPSCKCTSLPGCVAYLRRAYKFKRRMVAGKQAEAAESKLRSLYNGS